MHQRGSVKSNHVCFCDQPTLRALCIVHSSANGRSKSCIFEMPLGQVVIGSVQDGGGTELTWGSGLLIEWWKTDREWEGMTDTDGWIDKWLEEKKPTTSLQSWYISERLHPSLMCHLPHFVTFRAPPWQKPLVSGSFQHFVNHSGNAPWKHLRICMHH